MIVNCWVKITNRILYIFSVSSETQALAVFSNKESVQREVKATLSQKETLSCSVSDSKTEVKWFKDGKQLISSRTIYSEVKGNTRQLVIEKVERSDAGEYTCEAGGDKLVFKVSVSGKTTWRTNKEQNTLVIVTIVI